MLTLSFVLLLALLAGLVLVGRSWFLTSRRTTPPEPGPVVEPTEEDDAAAWDRALRHRTAIHEAGHVLAVWACPFAGSLDRVVIHAAGGRVMYTWPADEDDDNVLWAHAVIALAGLAAELTVYQRFRATEARKDLEDAREAAAALVRRGSSAPPDWVVGAPLPFERMFSTGMPTAQAAVLRSAYAKARALVRARAAERDRIADLLLEHQHLTEADIEQVLGARGIAVNLGRFTTRFPFVT